MEEYKMIVITLSLVGLIILVASNLLVEAKKYKRFSTNWWLSLFSVIPIEV